MEITTAKPEVKPRRLASLLLSLVLLTGCGLKYAGTNAGLQTVSPFSRMRCDVNSASAYTITVISTGSNSAFHLQPIVPLDGSDPVLGVGWDYNIDSLFK